MPIAEALQGLPSVPGAWLDVRRWRWMSAGGIVQGAFARLHVTPLEPGAPDLDTFLLPADRPRPLARGGTRRVSRQWLRQWAATWPATALPAIGAAAAVDCPIRLLSYQLSPMDAVVRGTATRLLLCDEVGAGKTIEAGLVVAELAARHAADRVLVLTPSSLRDQWQAELATRCGVHGTVVDRHGLREICRRAAPGLRPFDAPVRAIMSIDLAKQPDVLASLTATTWDVLIVDEAHAAAGDSSRMAAAQALGRHARLVLLVSATPHSGDEAAFARLCRIGDLGDGALVAFRRRAHRDRGIRPPAIVDVAVRRTTPERLTESLLLRYVRRLERSGSTGARLVAATLRKRALSSPSALWHSLRHRADWLAGQRAGLLQPPLPFDAEETDQSDAEPPSALREPGLSDPGEELRLLQPVLQASGAAMPAWGKAAAIARLLARTREQVVIFTEYRDTLDALVTALDGTTCAVLHGSLDRAERSAALRRFSSAEARVLVATDVAAEGLNLQHARVVVHVELPWSPARIEQRNGRVNRIGQRRRVHVWRLLGNRAHEARVVAALAARVSNLRAAGFEVSPGALTGPAPNLLATSRASQRVDLRDGDCPGLAASSALLRSLLHACRRPGIAPVVPASRGRLAWRRVRRPTGLPPGIVLVCLLPAPARGCRAELIAVHVALRRRPEGSPSAWLPAIARVAASAIRVDDRLAQALERRERRLLAEAENEIADRQRRWQASLFERRADRIVAASREAATRRASEHRQRLAELQPRHAHTAVLPLVALLVG